MTPDPIETNGFRPLGSRPEPVRTVERGRVGTELRQYRAADGFAALLPEEIVERMLLVAKEAAPNEAFALLVGRLCEDGRGPYVLVSGIVPDGDAKASPVHVATTVEGERRMRAIARSVFPEASVLGWVHTHPGHGAAYSSTDRRTQATWTAPHSLGIVVDWTDPAELAVYRGPGCELLRRSDCHAKSSVDAVTIVPIAPRRSTLRRGFFHLARRFRVRRRTVRRVLTLVLLATAGALAFWGFRHLRALENRVDALERRIGARQERIERTIVAAGESSGKMDTQDCAGVCERGPHETVSLLRSR